jgi:hypothetical protein
MKSSAVVSILLALTTGCTSNRLRDRVVNQTGTLTDLQYKQVLGNLARLHTDPFALPSQSNLHDGTAQLQTNAGANITLFRSSMLPPSLNGSRTIVEQWSVRPVTDDTALKLLRLAYQRALGMPVSLVTEEGLANDLAHDLKKQIAWPENAPTYTPGSKAKADPNQGTTTPPNFQSTIIDRPSPLDRTSELLNAIRFNQLRLQDESGVREVRPAPKLPEPTPQPTQPPPPIPGPGAARRTPSSKTDGGVRLAQVRSLNIPMPATLANLAAQPPSGPVEGIPIVAALAGILPVPDKSKDPTIAQDIADSMHIIKLSEDYFAEKYKTSNSEDIVSDEELKNIDAFQPGKSTVMDGVISGSAREVRRQVKEVEKDLLKIQPGWVQFGHKPPHDAFYVGRYGATYAWVDADHGRELAEFALIVLNLSDLIKENTVTTSPGGIRFSPSPTH